jgi:protein-tyrosine phosphatase
MKVCFVCTGNINRSPAAEMILRDLAGDAVEVCSAGVNPANKGKLMTKRMREELLKVGVPVYDHRAEYVTDLNKYDIDFYMYMQPSHRAALIELLGVEMEDRLIPLVSYLPGGLEKKIPDPAFDSKLFPQVVQMLQEAINTWWTSETGVDGELSLANTSPEEVKDSPGGAMAFLDIPIGGYFRITPDHISFKKVSPHGYLDPENVVLGEILMVDLKKSVIPLVVK